MADLAWKLPAHEMLKFATNVSGATFAGAPPIFSGNLRAANLDSQCAVQVLDRVRASDH